MAQEALANAAHHAHPSRVAITLSYLDDEVALDVVDDGVGFDPASVSTSTPPDGSGYGLTAMRQRVSERGGTLEVESEPGGGTAVSVRVPLTVEECGVDPTSNPTSGAEPTSLAATVP